MKIRKLQMKRTTFVLILISLVIVCFASSTRINVSSQDREAMNNTKVSKTPPEKDDKGDDGIQEYIDILNESGQNVSSSKKTNAIKQLGFANVKRAIPVLIKYLDYVDISKLPQGNNIDISDGISTPASKYPAIGALTQFDKESLPDLIKIVEKEDLNSTRSKNARQTIQYIFLKGNLLDGVLYLEKAASESKESNGSERLLKVAQELSKMCESNQRL
jgi:hypothetical protein